MELIEVRGIEKTYGLNGARSTVLKNVTFSIKKGEFVSLMGPSGSGKSTLLHILGFLDRPTVGEYFFDGSRLNEAHNICAKKVYEAMEKETPRIFVHNTMTENWEIEPYLILAKKHDYRVFSIIIENRHEHSSTHGAPKETLRAMRQRFETQL